MVTFFTRIIISLIGIIGASFFAVISQASFGSIIFFLCIWVSVCDFERLFWWIVCIAFFYSIMQYDFFGVYFFGIIGAVYFFGFFTAHMMRNRQESTFTYYIVAAATAGVSTMGAKMIYRDHMLFEWAHVCLMLACSVVLFFLLRWIVMRLETYSALYRRDADVKCHT